MRLLFALFMFTTFCVHAQEADSTGEAIDSALYVALDTAHSTEGDDKAPADTSVVTVRNFDSQQLNELRNDSELQYGVEATVGESLWDRFLSWIGEQIAAILKATTTTNWGRVLMYILLVAGLVVVILMVLKVDAFRIFYGESNAPIPHHTLDENIHEMDFEQLIQQAIAAQDYRLAVRLRFLYALKMLSDKNHIHWMQGKTNHDYLNELMADDLKKGFGELNYFFEYAWYGNFAINEVVYARVKQTFDEWRSRI